MLEQIEKLSRYQTIEQGLDMLDTLDTLDMLDILRDASSSVLHDPNILIIPLWWNNRLSKKFH